MLSVCANAKELSRLWAGSVEDEPGIFWLAQDKHNSQSKGFWKITQSKAISGPIVQPKPIEAPLRSDWKLVDALPKDLSVKGGGLFPLLGLAVLRNFEKCSLQRACEAISSYGSAFAGILGVLSQGVLGLLDFGAWLRIALRGIGLIFE